MNASAQFDVMSVDLTKTASRLARLGGWSVDLASSKVRWSDEVYLMHEVEPGAITTAGDTMRHLAPEYSDLVMSAIEACARDGKSFDLESESLTGSGSRFPVRLTGEAVRDAEGRVIGIQGAFQDLTRWKALNDTLGERDAQLRLVESAVARTNDLVMITEAGPLDEPGPNIVYVNDSFVSMSGYARHEVIGRSPFLLFGPRTSGKELERIESAVGEARGVKVELILYRKDGTQFWVEGDVSFLLGSSGEVTHLVNVMREISGRKAIEGNLALNEERFRLVTEATSLAVWDWDIARNSIWWREPAPRRAAARVENFDLGNNPLIGRVHLEDRADVLASIAAFMAGTADDWSAEYRFQRADGSFATALNRGFAIRDSDGKVVRAVGVVTDVTDTRMLEAKLHRAQRLEAVGQLTGGVAHDFNNLLTVILGNSEMLFDSLAHDPELGYLASITHSAAERGAQLTKRLLAFARQQPLQPRAFDVNVAVAGMHGLLRRTLAANIELVFDAGVDVHQAFADGTELESAVLNLAINARDAMPDGGRLIIETSNAVVDDAYAAANEDLAPGNYVVLSVSDTGTGMTSEVLSQVFEPFFTTKPFGEGSGLGLSMIYGYVKQSNGHIKIYSEVGFGTTVRIYLPAATEEERKEPHFAAVESATGGREKILLVEDDQLVQDFVARQLTDLGYTIVKASNADEAMSILKDVNDFDLLFTDIVMPGGMNGRQLADAATELFPDLPVLFTSGYTENAIVHAGRLDRGVTLLNKPYNRAELALKVRQVLDRVTRFGV